MGNGVGILIDLIEEEFVHRALCLENVCFATFPIVVVIFEFGSWGRMYRAYRVRTIKIWTPAQKSTENIHGGRRRKGAGLWRGVTILRTETNAPGLGARSDGILLDHFKELIHPILHDFSLDDDANRHGAKRCAYGRPSEVSRAGGVDADGFLLGKSWGGLLRFVMMECWLGRRNMG